MEQRPTLLHLNQECLLHLFSFLGRADRASLSRACTRLRSVYEDPALWTDLRFGSLVELNRGDYRLGAALRRLDVCWYSSRVKVCNVEPWRQTELQRAMCCQHEGVVGDFLLQVSLRCPNLERLSLAGCAHVTDEQLGSLLRRCPRLRSLSLHNCRSLTDAALEEAGRLAPGLTHVRADWCRNVTPAGLAHIRAVCPALQVLSGDRVGALVPDEPPPRPPSPGRPKARCSQWGHGGHLGQRLTEHNAPHGGEGFR
ncbi:F-box and leucine-rich protein 22 [Lethenteron reissneri]|uniref:F-box and leucine-rich protein 22 n=1 Tax=Lethenteron reissneri TaxID=7753 RepID=UPI002AB650D1|nr:F-box and leucine-rich protein 22 [Lethenteron reissneri]